MTVATRGLFAIGRYRFVAALSALSLGLYVVLAIVLRGGYGREGLAGAFLISALAGGAAAAISLVHELDVPLRRFGFDVILMPLLLASLFAGGAYAGAHSLSLTGSSLLVSAERLVISAGAGLIALGGAVLLLRTDDYQLVVRTVDRLWRP